MSREEEFRKFEPLFDPGSFYRLSKMKALNSFRFPKFGLGECFSTF